MKKKEKIPYGNKGCLFIDEFDIGQLISEVQVMSDTEGTIPDDYQNLVHSTDTSKHQSVENKIE